MVPTEYRTSPSSPAGTSRVRLSHGEDTVCQKRNIFSLILSRLPEASSSPHIFKAARSASLKKPFSEGEAGNSPAAAPSTIR